MTAPVAVIGAGPAGLAAALALARRGVPCIVFDDNAQPGGQYLRQLPPGFVRARRLPHDAGMASLLAAAAHPRVHYRPETTVWALPAPGTVAFAGRRGGGRERVAAIIVAAGAHDRPHPFPGWTLPGVITAGGCLNLIKGQAMAPGGDVVVAGTGPLVLLTAANLLRAGARVVAVAEAGRPSRQMARALPDLLAGPRLLAKGLRYRAALLRAGVPIYEGSTVVRADGAEAVARVTLAKQQGRTVAFAVDSLVIGYGLQPSVELTRIAGCEHAFLPHRGGWVPVRSAQGETSVPLLFAAGECGGIGGAELARADGRFVGEAVAARLGHGPPARAGGRARRLRFRDGLECLYAAGPMSDVATAETVICRCEEVTRAEIEEVVRHFGSDLAAVKVATRLSMGPCQGRNCLGPAAEILASAAGCPVASVGWPRMRPPARPVPVAALLGEALGPARPPDAPEPART